MENGCVRVTGGNFEAKITDLSFSVYPRPAGLLGRGRGWRGCAAVFALVFLFAFGAAAQTAPPKQPPETLKKTTLQLFKAVELNDMPAVKASIEAGADLNAENDEGMTAADVAVDRGHFIIAHYLLSRRLLGRTQPIALSPGKAKEAATQAAKAKAKKKFATPPAKPARKPPGEAQEPEAPATVVRIPRPQEEVAEALDVQEDSDPFETSDTPETPEALEVDKAQVEAAPSDSEEIVEVPSPPDASPPAGKPLAEQSVAQFFKSLVELITPGGEKPAVVAESKDAPDKEAGAEPESEKFDDGLPPPEAVPVAESAEDGAIETVVEEPAEIVVEVTGDEIQPGESVERIIEGPPGLTDDTDLETVTVETDLDASEDEGGKPGEKKPEEDTESFLDKMAALFKSGDKEKPGEPKAEQDAAAPDKVIPPIPGGDEVMAYKLSLPPPRPIAPKKFSPRFLDRLADFLESGDEEAFKAWLPEMQIMAAGAGDVLKPSSPAPEGPPAASPPGAGPEPPMAVKPAQPREPWSATVAREDEPGKAAEAASGPEAPGVIKPEAPGVIKNVFDKLVGVLTPDFGDKKRPEKLVLDPEETLSTAGKTGDEAKPPAAGESPSKPWPVTEVKTAETPPLAVKGPAPATMFATSLTGVTLSLGKSVSLENSFPPMGQGFDPLNQCVKKNRGTTLFCLEPVDWPERMQPDFQVPTILYTGYKAIARYDQGIASRFHVLFPSEAFERVIAYFHGRFGEPTDVWNRSIAPFAKPRQDNPTLAWRSLDPKTQAVTVLEIRKYDDSRGGFPDTKRGAVMLYLANSPPIFPQVSSHELMRLSRSRMAPPPAPAAPGAAPGETPEAPGAGTGPGMGMGDEPGAEPGVRSPADIKAERKAKRRADREAKRAAGAAKRAAEAAAKEGDGAVPGEPPGSAGKPAEDLFELPPDPLGR